MILIYSPVSSVRLNYTVKQLFGRLLGSNYEITDNKDAFLVAQGVRINYSDTSIEGSIHIIPNGFLSETSVSPLEPQVGKWKGVPTLFPTDSEIPFDIFSAVFYLLSRYEEYTSDKKDKYGRFEGKSSIAYKNNFLHLPLINIWADYLRELLNEKFSANIKPVPYKYISTIDIDHVFYYKYKPLLRNILGGLKQLIKGDLENVITRAKTILGNVKDPNGVYEWLESEHEKTDTNPIFFFLIGDGKPPYDPQPIYHKKEVEEVITAISEKHTVGIHPSYHSLNNVGIIEKEKQRLEKLSGKTVSHSRQHYLRFSLPETYRTLINCGITNEYSMGYADVVGFRASIASAFTWFDLEKNEETNLTVHPFAVMDVSLKNYMGLSPEQSIEKMEELNAPVKKHGGTFMSLWHNESMSEHGEWKNWRKVYQLLLTFSAQNGN